MDSFLRQVAQRVADAHPKDTDRVLVVFNNRRSVRFFQRQFASLGRTTFLPRTMAIDDLVTELGGLESVPNEFLLFELYRIHLELEGEKAKYKTFDEFIAFGDLMLGTFAEVDQYCVDAECLFVNLHALKDVMEWDVEGENLTEFQRDYLHFYRSLYEYYRRLRERLLAEGKAYGGMAYRHVAEHIGEWIARCPCEAVYFVGFNAISECERRIIGEFVRCGVGHLMTDGDDYFMRPDQESGYFLRKHKSEFPELEPHGPSLFGQGKRTVTIVECPENVLQCKLAGRLLLDHPAWLEAGQQEQTAVVLADESLLLPCLNALPEGKYDVNISMGYAFCDTAMHLLTTRLLALWRGADDRGFYHVHILEVLSDRHIARLLGGKNLHQYTSRFFREGNIIRCKGATVNGFLGNDKLTDVFTDHPLSVSAWLDMMHRLVAAILDAGLLETNKKELQAAGSLVEILDYLADLQQRYSYIDNLGTLEKIYLRIAQRHQIPLLGEPLSGLQVMGMLETRNIDFRRIILLSAGEGMLPAARSAASLVPYDLKRHFEMPTYQEKDAVYAYNFYHLLLRAEEVYLVYSSESEAMGKGEPSRFLRQVESELAPCFGIDVRHWVVNNSEAPVTVAPDTVGEKSESVMLRLREMAARGLSPTSFSDYLECPMRYCYTRVLGISEEDTLDEDLDASQLGTAVHNVLQHIYEPYLGRTVPVEGLRQALDNLTAHMRREFDSLFLHGRTVEGTNHYLRSVAETQLRALLTREIALLEAGHTLEMVALEEPLGPLELADGVFIKGKVDRIDRFDGCLRIIDYKTGSLHDNEIAFTSKGDNPLSSIPGKWFQLMCYALLYLSSDGRDSPPDTLQAAIYPLRYLRSDVRTATWDGVADLTPAMMSAFRGMLASLCCELLDSDTPFRPTDRKERCRYCDVRYFCPEHP